VTMFEIQLELKKYNGRWVLSILLNYNTYTIVMVILFCEIRSTKQSSNNNNYAVWIGKKTGDVEMRIILCVKISAISFCHIKFS